ncbi:Protein held out wings [Folsomia candida]|uniref:Protein held out wings n=1 Tax=Folsomia candida TaxID=158441 RepID=A0A226DD39_FOLCA|nr:Protein held out wings [Folsomia candida]
MCPYFWKIWEDYLFTESFSEGMIPLCQSPFSLDKEEEEIARVRGNLFHLSGTKVEPLELPEPVGPVVTSSEKVYVPVKEHPDFNFVGRILGPRGMTAKQLEQETGCKIMEEVNRGKPNWEHLNDELHVLITVEDTENRAKVKLQRAVDEVKKLLIPAEGEDELKKRQLMELAIINGTYRDSKESRDSRNQAAVSAAAAQLVSPQQVPLSALRAASTPLGFYGFLKHKNMMESLHSSPYLGQLEQQTHLLNFDATGAPLIISPHRLSNGLNAAAAAAAASGHPQLMAQHGDSLLYAASPYTTADYATYLQLAEYPPEHGGLFAR